MVVAFLILLTAFLHGYYCGRRDEREEWIWTKRG